MTSSSLDLCFMRSWRRRVETFYNFFCLLNNFDIKIMISLGLHNKFPPDIGCGNGRRVRRIWMDVRFMGLLLISETTYTLLIYLTCLNDRLVFAYVRYFFFLCFGWKVRIRRTTSRFCCLEMHSAVIRIATISKKLRC